MFRIVFAVLLVLSGCGGYIKINPALPKCDAVCETWGEKYGWETESQLYIVFDKDMNVLKEMHCGNLGTTIHTSCSVRSVQRLASTSEAKFIAHYHNHSVHTVQPYFGKGDIQAIQRINRVADEAGLELVDAFVMLPGRITSARREGIL